MAPLISMKKFSYAFGDSLDILLILLVANDIGSKVIRELEQFFTSFFLKKCWGVSTPRFELNGN